MQALDERLDSLGIASITLYRHGRSWRAVAGTRSGHQVVARSANAEGIADALEAAARAASVELPPMEIAS
jgi:hypothetical protein